MMIVEKLPALSEVPRGFLRMRDKYLFNANEMIENGEWRKASELLWGAVTQAIKALASTSNIAIREHGKFFIFIKDLGKEIGDKEIYTSFLVLNSLHVNFYDKVIPDESFPIYCAKVEQFLEKLESIMAIKVM